MEELTGRAAEAIRLYWESTQTNVSSTAFRKEIDVDSQSEARLDSVMSHLSDVKLLAASILRRCATHKQNLLRLPLNFQVVELLVSWAAIDHERQCVDSPAPVIHWH